jgi:hypothetical protein
MNIVRKLVPTGTGWRIESGSNLDAAAQGISVSVEGVLLPSNAKGAGLWVGYDARSPANRYAGWGWPADRLFSLKEDLLPLAGESPEIGALLLPGLAIAVAVNCLLPMQRAAILGKGLLAALVEEVLTCRNVQIEPVQPGAVLSLIVDTSGDPTVWSSSLDALCGEGTLLLLVPPWSTPADFNFYPYLHRHSLRVIARRWHRLPPVSEWVDRDSLAQVIASVLQRRRWLCPMNLNLGISETNGEAWQWFDWKPHKQKLEVGRISDA